PRSSATISRMFGLADFGASEACVAATGAASNASVARVAFISSDPLSMRPVQHPLPERRLASSFPLRCKYDSEQYFTVWGDTHESASTICCLGRRDGFRFASRPRTTLAA